MIEDVHDAIFDLVELIKTFKGKNKLSKLFLSTLFKRRQDELDAVVDRAIMRLQVSVRSLALLYAWHCGRVRSWLRLHGAILPGLDCLDVALGRRTCDFVARGSATVPHGGNVEK